MTAAKLHAAVRQDKCRLIAKLVSEGNRFLHLAIMSRYHSLNRAVISNGAILNSVIAGCDLRAIDESVHHLLVRCLS